MDSHAQLAQPREKSLFTSALGADEDQPKVLVVDSTGRLLDATPAARALLASGGMLCWAFGRLAGGNGRNAARLAQALAQAVRTGHAQSDFSTDDAPGLTADFVRMTGEESQQRIVVILKSAHEDRRRRVDEARVGYGLTAAEGRLLATLFEGCSVPQAAHRLGVARSTARTHLQRIFDKTGARRQGDLLRMVACA